MGLASIPLSRFELLYHIHRFLSCASLPPFFDLPTGLRLGGPIPLAANRPLLFGLRGANLQCAFPSAEYPTTSGRKPGRKTSPFEPGPSAHVVVELLLGLCLLRSCRRTVALTEALAASAISPLDKTRSQIIAPAVAAHQFL